MQGTPAILEEAPVGDLLGQGVLERVLEFREQRGLVKELGGLEAGEALPKGGVGKVRHDLEQGAAGRPCR